MTTIYATHPRYADHQMRGNQHPERPGRIQSVWDQIETSGLDQRLDHASPQPVSDEEILRVHTNTHIQQLTKIAAQDKMAMFDADTYALPESPAIARLAAGGVIAAVDAVLSGAADNGLAAVRPPGHHATPSRAMGFCLLNNIAIGARHAQATSDTIEKVLIVDFDVHHGNGTQDIFYEDNSVFFISTHQYPFYPGTGAIDDTGSGKGKGTTLNIPLEAGHGDANYTRIYDTIVQPAAGRFQPDLILVSAGFDAHFKDPLAGMQLSMTGYAQLARMLKQMAQNLCNGRIIFVMEGGYNLNVIGHGMRNIAHVLLDDDEISDPYGSANGSEPNIESLIEQIQSIHNL